MLAYIDGLPSYSAFIEASAQDDEVAEMYAEQEESGEYHPRLTEWTPERAELVAVKEAIQQLTAIVLNVAGSKADPPPLSPRPLTARDRLAAQAEDAGYEVLLGLIEQARQDD